MKPWILLVLIGLSGLTGCKPEERHLNIYIWTNYLPQDVVADFEKRTGIATRVDTYDSNETILAKLQSGVADYDIVVPSDYMLKVMIQQ